MRNKHKHQIANQLKSYGFSLNDFSTIEIEKEGIYRIEYSDTEMFFSFKQSSTNAQFYSYIYSSFNHEFTEIGSNSPKEFDIVFNDFTEWLVRCLRPFQEDKVLGDPFKAYQESKGFIFNEAEIIEDNPEDDSLFTAPEQETFAKELKAFESDILSKSLLQEQEIDSLKKSVNQLIEASRTESKSEVKKGVGKLLNDLAIELLKYGIIEGAKKYLLPLLSTLNNSYIDPHWIA